MQILNLLNLLVLLLLSSLAHAQQQTQNGNNVPTECRPPTPTTQLAPVEGPGKADIIFVIDTSGSMGTETTYVMNNINAFGQHLEDEGIDYRVIIVAQDQSCCTVCVNPPLAESNCAATGPRYRKLNQYIASLDACDRFLQSTIYGSDIFTNFLRTDAAKTIVFVSDDDLSGIYDCSVISCKSEKALLWLNALQALDSTNNFFKPSIKLPHGVMVHTIDGHTCSGEPGYNQAFTYIGLAEATGGTNFQLCQNDWSSYFSTIAGAVADSTQGTKCEHDIPRSETNSALLVGNLEPDTPFSLTFEYTNQAPASGKTLLTFTQSPTNTCAQPGCTYTANPCVCAMRCPVGYTRDTNDASQCKRQAQPTCSLAHCYSTTVNNGLPDCALSSQERLFTVNDPSDPRKAIFCDQTCHLVRSFTQGGDLNFDFHPVAKLRSMTVAGRGSRAKASFGAAKTLNPAKSFPVGHPATSRSDCGGAPSRPTIPKIGPALFDSVNCSPASGESLFYALNPSTGRSQTFATGAGLMIFFLVNAVGESYLGIQIGHYPNAAAASSGTPVASGYGVIDIVLSGTTIQNMQPPPSWVVQDGNGGSNFGGTSISTKKTGRVVVSNIVGKTAGGILGPLPAYDFCVDLIIVEASGSVNSVSIVNFDTDPSTPAQPEQFKLDGDFMDQGGLRFCANSCNGDVVLESESRNSVTCWTNKKGNTYCPDQGEADTHEATSGGGGGTSGDAGGRGGTNRTANGTDGTGKRIEPHPSWIEEHLMYIVLIATMCFLLCCVTIVVIVFRRKKKKDEEHYAKQSNMPELSSNTTYEMTNKGKRRSTCSVCNIGNSDWELVLDPASGDQYYYNHVTNETSWDAPNEVKNALDVAKRENSFGRSSSAISNKSKRNGLWYPFATEDGHTAFANSVTGEVVWEIPEGGWEEESPYTIDEGDAWVSFETEDGYTAYKNEITGQVSWEKPNIDGPEVDMMNNPMGRGRNSIEV